VKNVCSIVLCYVCVVSTVIKCVFICPLGILDLSEMIQQWGKYPFQEFSFEFIFENIIILI
jgi:hypothetical protein